MENEMDQESPARSPRSIALPNDLRGAIVQSLATVSTARWMREAQALSDRYRAQRSASEPPLMSDGAQALGYAALILPATYAQLWGPCARRRRACRAGRRRH